MRSDEVGRGSETILVRLTSPSNQTLIHSWISEHDTYTLARNPVDLETARFDCAIFDIEELLENKTTLLSRKSSDRAVLPYLLLVPETTAETVRARLQNQHGDIWEQIDGVLEMPIEKYRFEDRLETVLRIRRQSVDFMEQQSQLRRFKRASEAAGHAIYITDSDGRIEYVNPAFEHITGYSEGEAMGENPRLLKSGEMPDDHYEDLWEAVLSGEVWDEEVINRRKDGELYHAHQTIAPITEDEHVESFVAIQTDITHRKEREAELERYERIVENVPIGVYQTTPGPEGEFRLLNEATVEIFGADSEAELRAHSPSDIYANPDQRKDFSDRVCEEGLVENEEMRLQTLSGDSIWAEVTCVTGWVNNELIFDCVLKDVTERKEYEQRLKRYKQAIESSKDMLSGVDQDQRFIFANQTYREFHDIPIDEDITGLTNQELHGDQLSDIEPYVKRALDGETVSYEMTRENAQGEERVLDVFYTPLRDEDGTILGQIGAFRDITDRKEYELGLIRYKQAVESSTEMLAAADTDQNFLFANDAYRDFHGIPTDEDLSGKSNLDLHGPDRYEKIQPYIERALDGESFSYEMERTNSNGKTRTLDIHYSPIEDENGDILGHVAAMRDVTEKRERTEEIRRLSEYRRVLSKINQWLVRADSVEEMVPETANIIASSEFFECTFITLVDESSPEFVCESGSELIDEEVASFHTKEYLETVFESGTSVIDDVTAPPFDQHVEDRPSHAGLAVAITHEGDEFGILTVHLPPDVEPTDEEKRFFEGISDDIGFFLRSREIESERQTFKEIAERIDDPVMLQGLDGNFRVVNQAVAEFADLNKDGLIGKDEFAFMDDDDAEVIQAKKAKTLREHESVTYRISPSLPRETDRTFSTLRYPHYDSNGDLDGTVAICRDVTDLEERERQLHVIDRVLRHNLHNDMNVIEGYARTIHEQASGDLEAYAGKILDNSSKLVDTVGKERQITKFLSDPPQETTIDLVPVIDTITRTATEGYPNAEISTTLPERCRVTANEAIGQAIEELIENAITHSGESESMVEVWIECEDSTVAVSVADNGPGIPEMERKVLTGEAKIEPLYHGSGLGLWLVNLIVNQSDGRLGFSEEEPYGSIVTIELEMAQ